VIGNFFSAFKGQPGMIIMAGLFAFVLQACDDEEAARKPVARVNDAFLYQDELIGIIPEGSSPEDSALAARQFIENWMRETVVFQKAEKNIADMGEIETRIADYRRSLIIFAYEKALVSQNLDTNVTAEEIEKYYTENQESFELKDNIIKVTYVKVGKKAPDIQKLKQWYKSEKEQDKNSLASYCSQYAENFFLDDTWLLFDDLLKEIPIKLYDKESFLQNNRLIEVGDSSSYYFLNIRGFKIKNSISPLSFEEENIRQTILNKRKLELIDKIKNEIFTEAQQNKDLEILEK
jgi:hypothetical protein